jgi:multidrug resistance efflux pump
MMMQAELAIVDALQSAGVSPEKARAAAAAVTKEIDHRYEIHNRTLATRGDVESARRDIEALRADVTGKVESLRADMFKMMGEQTWKLAAIVIAAQGLVIAALKWIER